MFTIVSRNGQAFESTLQSTRRFFPEVMSESDKSDHRHLARTVASGEQFFVTRDEDLLRIADDLYEAVGISVVSPSDVVIRLDELLREAEYHPARLAGTAFHIGRVCSGQERAMLDVFRCASKGERKTGFSQHMRSFLAYPQRFACLIAFNGQREPVALVVFDKGNKYGLEIPVACVSRQKFDIYYTGASIGFGVFLCNPRLLKHPISLGYLRQFWPGFRAPQGYHYVPIDAISFLGITDQLLTVTWMGQLEMVL